MRENIKKRARELAHYIIENKSTVRACAKIFDISKSTVHKDVSERLEYIDYELYKQVQKVLQYNLSVRHIHGGIATKNKYLQKKLHKQKKQI